MLTTEDDVPAETSKRSEFGQWIIEFVPHTYTISKRETGERLVLNGLLSVTTYIASLFPGFEPQAALNVMSSTTRNMKYTDLTDKEIAAYWKRNGEHASKLGTKAHAYIEQCMSIEMANPGSLFGKPVELYPVMPRPLLDAYTDISPRMPQDLCDADGTILKRDTISSFFGVMANMRYTPILAETMMYDDEMCLCGTVDAVFRNIVDGDIWIVDWKRRKEYKEPDRFSKYGFPGTPAANMKSCHVAYARFQLNIYRGMLVRANVIDGTKVKRMSIVSVHPYAQEGFQIHDVEIDDALLAAVVQHRVDMKT